MAAVKTKSVNHNTNTSLLSGRMHIEVGTIALDSSYPTGGEAITFNGFTPVAVMCQSMGGYVFSWDTTNEKLMVYWADYDGAADGVLVQFTNAGDLSALSAIPYIAVGF